ncbi:hypothetical protein BOTBODRAFT_179391 [Botryobasidium botryosum FD-172 SS1]|uniref:Uncharacterized protein n=1 Tax=Botryobasidium botryosum (strain FD-172 SS1) TaxID=930990 RepID=A0A067MB04_BOTB1|nr:hypothetical protein BOTBODRAFT_179391 [Botryobasidium botryosum FD-172 SS1]
MQRAAALEFAQLRTCKINPINYGVLLGLYAHLKWTIGHMVPVPPHVRQTSFILCLPEVAACFGMGLHNLDLNLTSPLDELAFKDRLLGVYKSLGYQEAMERWSSAYMFQRMTKVNFIPLTSGLQTEAARGCPKLSFLNQCPIFFPMPEENIRLGYCWLQFHGWHGYL